MKTSHFKKCTHGDGRVSIANYEPKGLDTNGLSYYKDLAPTRQMIGGRLTEADYLQIFTETILGPLDPQKVWNDLHELTGGAEPILLCWCRSLPTPTTCHRQIVAAWLNNALGHEIVEWQKPDKATKAPPPAAQGQLFGMPSAFGR